MNKIETAIFAGIGIFIGWHFNLKGVEHSPAYVQEPNMTIGNRLPALDYRVPHSFGPRSTVAYEYPGLPDALYPSLRVMCSTGKDGAGGCAFTEQRTAKEGE
jgi:hypothetical protein